MKILSAHQWMEKNKEQFPNGSTVSELVEAYAQYYYECKTENAPTPKDYEHVTLLLKEANKYGLEFEVDQSAKKYLSIDPQLSLVEAYTYGYKEWVK